MHRSFFTILAVLCLSGPLYGQETGEEGEGSTGEEGVSAETGGSHGGEGGASAEGRSITTRITAPSGVPARIAEIEVLCGAAGDYKIDCMAERFEAMEKDMALLAGHAPVREILAQTARGLRGIARENRDPQQPRIKLRSGSPEQSSHRPIVAVAPQRQAAALAAAVAVLEEAETLLLRSAENSASRAVNYQQIAAAIGSSKVLLRSS
ncbi:hypothetical protein [Leisingera sp. JC1]|uniref:hypothetical protein n=1 Tax=Leisingera sp. JC1 TaxID=1855282 RepID=UPI000AEA78C9|nr:hypothetical protein [Leisingera sp. JC1]